MQLRKEHQILYIKEAAEFLGWTRSKLERLIDQGVFTPMQMGKRKVFTPNLLELQIAAMEAGVLSGSTGAKTYKRPIRTKLISSPTDWDLLRQEVYSRQRRAETELGHSGQASSDQGHDADSDSVSSNSKKTGISLIRPHSI